MRYLIITFAVLLFSVNCNAQFTFSVSPGFGLYGASFGYQFDNFVPIAGVQYFIGSIDYEYNGYEYNGNNKPTPATYGYESDASIFMPYAGLKYFFNISSKLKPYAIGLIYKPFISATGKDKHTSEKYDDEGAAENLSLIGTEFGFGTEYYLDKNFSLGGEFGIRLLFGNTEYSVDSFYSYYDEVSNQYVEQPYKKNYVYSAMFGITYARINFNYYFE